MVLLFQRFSHFNNHKTSSNMTQSHGEFSSEFLSASLRSFESEVLNHLYQISLKPATEIYSVSWIQKCLWILPNIDKAFAKFVVEIDYPVKEWKSSVVEEYMIDSLSLLDHLNSISSSVSHMGQACMELLHALSLVKASPKKLGEILPKKRFQDQEQQKEEGFSSEKEMVVFKALLVRKRLKNWLCRTIDSSIRGDAVQLQVQPCLEMSNSSLVSLQSGICQEMKRKGVVKEVSEINEGVARLLAPAKEGGKEGEVNELRKRVEILGRSLEEIKGDINRMFSEAMVRRNELLDSLQHRKQ